MWHFPAGINIIAKKLSSILDNYKDITFKDLKIIKLLFYGTPRAGKTTLRKQLLKGVGDILQESDLQPSTNIAEICDPIFIERIVMTNNEGSNVWKWNVQKLDDIARTLLQCLENKQLQIAKSEDASEPLGPASKCLEHASLQECSGALSVPNEQIKKTSDMTHSPGTQPLDVVEEEIGPMPLTSPNESEANSLGTSVDIKQLFMQAIKTGQWSEVVSAINIDKATLAHVIDCGGQPSFQEIFPLLISGPALTLLVFKLTDDLQVSQPVEYQPDDGLPHTWQDTYVVRDFIFHAISGITDDKAFTDNKNPLNSNILLVGTHKDKLKGSGNKQCEITSIAKALHGWLGELKVFKSIDVKNVEDLIIGINNFEQQDLPKVKKRIEELVFQATPQDIPAPWLVFDFVLHSYARSKKLHRVEKIKCSEIARECGVKDDEFDVVLRYLHSTAGTLLYYSDIPELNNCVITDFQLIFDSISKIIIQRFEDNSKRGPHLEDKELFHETGQLEASVLRDVEGCLRVEELLSLMQYRHVVSKMDENRFFMPSVLPKADVSPSHSCSFLVMFECGYCPIGLFCAVTTALIVTYKWKLKKDDHQFRNKISFYCSCSGRSYRIIFSAFFSHYEVCLILDQENNATQDDVKVNIYKIIDKVFKKVCEDMHYKISPSYGFYCPNECTYRGVTYEPYKHPAKCTFDSKAKEMVCYYKDEPSDLTREHTSWFQQVISFIYRHTFE